MSTPLPYRRHDHEGCVQQAVEEARTICRQRGARLTPIRERVLELVWQSHQPLGAYDVLAALTRDGHKAAPPTVYRALDFLLELGLVHRIASLNAFVGCTHAGHAHTGCFLICEHCRNVLELAAPAIARSIAEQTRQQGFEMHHLTVEVSGRCPACRDKPLAPA